MIADLLGEFHGGVVAGAPLAVVHGGDLQDDRQISAGTDGHLQRRNRQTQNFFVILLFPAISVGMLMSSVIFLGGILATGVVVGIVESCVARYRFVKVPQMLVGALGLSLLALFFLIFFDGGIR